MLLPILSAILGIIAFLPVNFYPAGFVFIVPLFIFFLKEKNFWRLFLGAFVFKLIFGLGAGYFALEPILWVSALLIFFGLPASVWCVKKFFKQPYILISFPFLWTLFDILQAKYSLVPTYLITAGNSLGSSPFAGLAGLGGFVSLTFFAAIVNVLIAATIFYFIKNKDYGLAAIFIAATLAIISAAYLFSQYQLQKNIADYGSLQNSIKIASISIDDDFNFNQFNQLKNELIGKQFDFVIFPEDIFNEPNNRGLLNGHPYLLGSKTAFFMQNLAKELNVNLIAAFDTSRNGRKYNSAVVFSNRGEIVDIHDKSRLTFAGEYWPFGGWRPAFYDWIRKNNPKIGGYAVFNPQNAYASGDRKNLSINLKGNEVLFAAPICLEIQYPSNLKEYKNNGARFVINETSNRWVEKGMKHFLYLSDNLKKIEAIWLKTPIISSGVREFAGVILPNGETRLIGYENNGKNYNIFYGEIKY